MIRPLLVSGILSRFLSRTKAFSLPLQHQLRRRGGKEQRQHRTRFLTNLAPHSNTGGDFRTKNDMVSNEEQLLQDILYRVRQVNHMPPEVRSSLRDFQVDGVSLGSVTPRIATLLCSQRLHGQAIFQVTESNQQAILTFTKHAGSTPDSRSRAVAGIMSHLREDGVIRGWRDELYPIQPNFYQQQPPVFTMERAAVPLLGAREYGVHVNGLVEHGDGVTRMWMARRSPNKSKYPGMLDHIVAGGVPEGISLLDNVVKECMEEAGIPEQLARERIKPVGAISYETYVPEQDVISRAVLFCYDITLPSTFVPVPQDGEVEEFFLMTIDEVKATMARDYSDPIKPNCYPVIIDYLIREGHLSPEIPGYLDVLRELRDHNCR